MIYYVILEVNLKTPRIRLKYSITFSLLGVGVTLDLLIWNVGSFTWSRYSFVEHSLVGDHASLMAVSVGNGSLAVFEVDAFGDAAPEGVEVFDVRVDVSWMQVGGQDDLAWSPLNVGAFDLDDALVAVHKLEHERVRIVIEEFIEYDDFLATVVVEPDGLAGRVVRHDVRFRIRAVCGPGLAYASFSPGNVVLGNEVSWRSQDVLQSGQAYVILNEGCRHLFSDIEHSTSLDDKVCCLVEISSVASAGS